MKPKPFPNLIPLLFTFTTVTALTALPAQHQPLSLAGKWRFQLDRADKGLTENWAAKKLPDSIKLPGTLTAQGIGDPVTTETKWIGGIVDKSWFTAPEYAEYRKQDNIKIPFWLQPDLYYAGAAWFQRDIEIPKKWADKNMVLFLERPHWETRVWVDGNLVGTNNALATPHEYDLGPLSPGKHVLTIRVDNRMIVDIGENSHSVSDHTQGNWNGIAGRIELRPRPSVFIADLRVYPDVANKTFRVTGTIRSSAAGGMGGITFEVKRRPGTKAPSGEPAILLRARLPVTWDPDGATFEWAPSPANARLLQTWDEFSPNIYELTATLEGRGERPREPAPSIKGRGERPCEPAFLTVPLALRDISTSGTQFILNGRKLFFRGTLECAIFPKTGHPPTDVPSWKHVLNAARAHGLNMLRFHSWCPPEAAFVAADELGFYFHVEASSWANQSTTLGDGKPVDRWIYDETERILKTYGNHPSFLIMLYGNEPGGSKHKQYLAKWIEHYRALDPRRLYSSGAGWPQIPENQFHVTPDPRIQAWGGGLKSRINAKPPETITDYRDYISQRNVPVISHEIGQWCVYPNFDEISKYTGYLKPKNFEIFRDRLVANGMGKLAKDFLYASGKLQALCYKEDIESALRTPGMGGFQLLDLHDFPGQGTALVGVLDPFWEEKGYISPREYSRFCNSTVPLARLPQRAFTTAEHLTADIELSHFGPQPLPGAVLEWKLTSQRGRIFAQGELPARDVPIGNAIDIGRVEIPLKDVPAPAQCKLVTKVRGTDFENDWDVWIYPESKTSSEASSETLSQASSEASSTHSTLNSQLSTLNSPLVTSSFDDAAKRHLQNGGNLLLTLPGKHVRNFDKDPVKVGFSSIFWNTAWTRRQAPTTLGILCDPKHPALAQFPTDPFANWQWWYLLHRAGALPLDLLPPKTQPIVRIIDDWVTARPLGLIVEGKVGKGGIVICGFDLTRDADDPVSRQILASLCDYLQSPAFKPKTPFTPDQIQSLVALPKGLPGLRAIKASSEMGEYAAANAADGDPETIWHTPWGDGAPSFPHELILEFETPRPIAELTLLPRQDGNHNGWIKAYELYAGTDGKTWHQPVATGEFPRNSALKIVKLDKVTTARYLKLRALSGYANAPYASLAEINILPPP